MLPISSWRIVRVMDGPRFRATIKTLGLTQEATAKFLAVDPRTVRRWATSAKPVPRDVAMLLRLMLRYGVSPEDARLEADLPPPDQDSGVPKRYCRILLLNAVASALNVPAGMFTRMAIAARRRPDRRHATC